MIPASPQLPASDLPAHSLASDETQASGATSSAPASSAPRHGRYLILRAHARGGLGEVSLALDESLKRRVAVKEIRGEIADDPDARRRFVNEAEVTGQLDHPNIVPVYS